MTTITMATGNDDIGVDGDGVMGNKVDNDGNGATGDNNDAEDNGNDNNRDGNSAMGSDMTG